MAMSPELFARSPLGYSSCLCGTLSAMICYRLAISLLLATSYAHSKPKAWLPQVALPKTEQAFARNNKKQEGPCKELW